MKYIIPFILVVITSAISCYYQGASYTADSIPKDVSIKKAPNFPPEIKVSIEFYEPSGNVLLDAEETGFIMINIVNNGRGKASNLRVDVNPIKVANLTYESFQIIGDIEPNQTKKIKWPISASFDVESKKVVLTFTFKERNGFEPSPIELTFNTKAFASPNLILSDGVNIDDANQNGMIDPGELVKITTRLINKGLGKARDVKVQLRIGENVFYAADSPKEFSLGDINAGSYKDFTFTIYTNMRATDVPVFVDISEHYNKFGKSNNQLPLAFKRHIPKVKEISIAGKEEVVPSYNIPANLSIDVDYGIPKSKGVNSNMIAIIFGVESYRNVVPVPFARRDATIFQEYIKNIFGVPEDKNHIYFKTDDEVTKGEFDKVFSEDGWLTKRVNQESDVIIYYSGHGAPEIKGKTPYLIPSDGDPNYPSQTGYGLNRLYDELENLQCHSITVILDACFSGATRENKSLFADARPVFVQINHPALRSDKITVFTASGGDQISSDYPEMQHGLFTYFLLKGLKGEADTDKNGEITIKELENYITVNVKRTAGLLDREQTPQVFAKDKSRVLINYLQK